jgi:hypothetical protein
VAEKAEHTFDSGVETKAATKTSNGILTFTCTVCSYQKTQEIKYTPSYTVNESEWQTAQMLTNCTVKIVYNMEDFAETVIYEIAGKKAIETRGALTLYREKHNGVWYLSIDGITATQTEFSPTLSYISQRDIPEYDDYLFDNTVKAYVSYGHSAIYFEDSLITKCILYYPNGTVTVTITNYNSTNLDDFPTIAFWV